MAAYRNTDIIIRTFKVPLRQTVKTQADYDWIDAYQTGLEGEVNACLRNDELMRQAMMLDIKSKGKFETEFNKLANQRYKDADYALSGGNQAKSFQIRRGKHQAGSTFTR